LVVVSPAQVSQSIPQSKSNAANNGPADAKAKKTYDQAIKLLNDHQGIFALDGFRKADKQDGGHCVPCELQAWIAAIDVQEYKAAREESVALLDRASSPGDKAQAQFLLGQAWLGEGMLKKHDKAFEAADAAFQQALRLNPGYAACLYADGTALAHLMRDDAAKERFQQYLKVADSNTLNYARARRFAERPELARARVAPNFRLTTLDGGTLTLESLAGKVVLIDFWATWCGPCREALPHVRKIAKDFEDQPFVVLSISLDDDEGKWKDFVAKNQMTWLQYRDGGFDGTIATLFGVTAIPATFTIDADGVLEDQRVGDADIEGKLKKLIAHAAEAANRKAAPATANKSTGGAE
jgi:thiol-disulfide isomerase/thioredoxin